MRHFQKRLLLVHIPLVLICLLLGLTTFGGPKGETKGQDKISPGLAKVLEYYQADKNIELPVIVQVDRDSFHPHGAPPGLVKGLVEEKVLGIVRGYSGKMSVKDIQKLVNSRFIQHISLDATVRSTVTAAIYYVRPDGNDSNPGTSDTFNGAWRTIQKAASVMVAGDTVNIAAGTYFETVAPSNSGTALDRITYQANGQVTIDGQNARSRAFDVHGKSFITIDGFEFTDHPDTGGYDATVYFTGSDFVEVRNCIFHDTGRDGIGLHDGSNDALIENNLFYNIDDDGVTPKGSGNHTLRNNTFYSCGGWAIEAAATSGNHYENNILWDQIDSTSGSVTYAYNDYIGGILPGIGNISEDPLFLTASYADFHLRQTQAGQSVTSPAVDAGSSTATEAGLNAVSTRSDGVADGGTVDLGYHYTFDQIPVFAAVYYVRPDGNDANPGTADTPSEAWRTIQKAANIMVAGDTVNIAAGTYYETVVPSNGGTAYDRITYKANGQVTIDGENSRSRAFNVQGKFYITIDGFEFTNHPDTGGYDATVYFAGSDFVEIRNSIFHDTGRDGIGLHDGSNDALIENNLFYNIDDDGVTPKGSGNHTLRNNTFYSCGGWAIEAAATSGNHYENNILWDQIDSTSGSVTYAYNDYIGGILPGIGNISEDPLFLTASYADFHLRQTQAGQSVTSPAVDAGSLNAIDAGLDSASTRSDSIADSGPVDLGYHYSGVVADPGIALAESDSMTETSEQGMTDYYDVALRTQPSAEVTVYLQTTAQLATDRYSLVFTQTNWSVPQRVVVGAINDLLVEGTHSGSIYHTVSTSDPTYAGIGMPSLQVSIIDDDSVLSNLSLGGINVSTLGLEKTQNGNGLANEIGYQGSNIAVAVFDSGMAPHFELGDRIQVSVDFTGASPTVTGHQDAFGHGTHVAGIIGGQGLRQEGDFSGVAPEVSLLSLKVLGDNGAGQTSDVIEAIEWVIQNKDVYNIRVANLSLGHPAFESYLSDPLCQATRSMVEAGIVTVVSAGNLGKTANHPEIWGGITSPGTEPSVITVGAVNTQGTATRSDDVATSYSSRGYSIPDQLFKPDLVAPGNQIPSLNVPGSYIDANYPSLQIDSDYIALSGSSMATAFVSGAAAIVLDANPDLTPNLVKTILLVTATKMDQPHMFEQGNGFLNAHTAVKLAEQVDVANHDLLGEVSPLWILDGENGEEEVWAGGAFVWGQRILYSDLVTPNSGFWGDSVIWADNLFGPESVLWADTFFNPDSVIWSDFFNSVIWADFFNSVIWADASFDPESVVWSDFFDSVIWADFLDSVIWADNFDSVVWADFFDSVVWSDFFDSVIWADYFDSVVWSDFFDSVIWADFFDSVIWADFFDSVIWADLFDPGSVIWADFFDSVIWADSVIWTDDPANSTEGD